MTDVTVTLTREQAMKVVAVITGVATAQQFSVMQGNESAARIDPDMPDITDAGKKIMDALGMDTKDVDEILVTLSDKLLRDTTTDAEESPSSTDDIDPSMYDLSPEMQRIVLATEFDDPIVMTRDSLYHFTSFTPVEYEALHKRANDILTDAVGRPPQDLRVSQAMPYVMLSDAVLLGVLCAETYKRREEYEEHNHD